MFYRRQTKNVVNYSFTTFYDFFEVVPPATENRVDIALSFSKLYLCYDVSPLNKVFTTLHRSTSSLYLGYDF